MKSAKMLTILVLAMGLMVCQSELVRAAPMGTAFTYQGRLMDKNKPADGLYDFQFKLFDDANIIDGNQVGWAVYKDDVDVIDGHIVVELDFFQISIFNGDARWLETTVAQSDGSDPCTLTPRVELTPTPYALYAKTSGGDNDWMISGNDMYSIPSGNVGIGTSTPARKLEVRDTEAIARLTSDGSVGSRLELHNINEDPDTLGFINFSHYFSGVRGQIAYSWDGMDFKTANVQRMRIHKNGNVGIGTTTPGGLLHLSSAGGIDLVIEADTNNYGEDQNARLVLSQDGGQVTGRIGYRAGLNKLEIMQQYKDSLILGTNNTDRLTITGAGRVGIGTSGPGGILEVSHDGESRDFLIHESTGNVGIGVSNPGARLHIEQGGSASGSLVRVVSYGAGLPGFFSVANPDNIYPALQVYSISKNAPALIVSGRARVDILEVEGADIAEKFPVSEKAKPGMVLAIDPEHPGQLCLSRGAYNRCVAGVVSGANGLPTGAILGNLPQQEDAMPVALTGRVWVHCDATQHPIEPGDLLTTAERAGYAMAVTDYQRAQGAVIGKAMTRLKNGTVGLVLTLVNLQ